MRSVTSAPNTIRIYEDTKADEKRMHRHLLRKPRRCKTYKNNVIPPNAFSERMLCLPSKNATSTTATWSKRESQRESKHCLHATQSTSATHTRWQPERKQCTSEAAHSKHFRSGYTTPAVGIPRKAPSVAFLRSAMVFCLFRPITCRPL